MWFAVLLQVDAEATFKMPCFIMSGKNRGQRKYVLNFIFVVEQDMANIPFRTNGRRGVRFLISAI